MVGVPGRRLDACGFEVDWVGTRERVVVRPGAQTAAISGSPGELLLFLFGRTAAARVEVSGTRQAVAAVRRTHFGMFGVAGATRAKHNVLCCRGLSDPRGSV